MWRGSKSVDRIVYFGNALGRSGQGGSGPEKRKPSRKIMFLGPTRDAGRAMPGRVRGGTGLTGDGDASSRDDGGHRVRRDAVARYRYGARPCWDTGKFSHRQGIC